MLLVHLILATGTPGVQVWRSNEEVYALLRKSSTTYAATSGGVLAREDGDRWQYVGQSSPVGIRSLSFEEGALQGVMADGRAFRLKGEAWVASGKGVVPPPPDVTPPPNTGAVASARSGDLVSFWGAKRLLRQTPSGWDAPIERPPADGDYALLQVNDSLWAGTNNGLYVLGRGGWRKQSLPGDLPVARVQGLAQTDGRWLVGGLTGLYMGSPRSWTKVSDDSVREIASFEGDPWVLYGNGSVEKLVPGLNRRYPDLLHGAVKRPWTSLLTVSEGKLFAGGQEGWVEKTADGWAEHYPWMLKGQVVTAICAEGENRWVGTQTGGLYRFEKLHVLHWTPAQGLTDQWVTSLAKTPAGMAVGTAGSGLFVVGKSGKVRALPTPSKRIRRMTVTNGHLAVGALEGAWISRGPKWQPLPSVGEETTGLLSTGPSLTVLTAGGVFFVPQK